MDTKVLKPMLAEFIGTFYLCFAGIAAILSLEPPYNSGAGIVGVALAHGLALSIAVSTFGGISGAHFNPAVTLGILATGRISGGGAVRYIISQLAGATVAALACKAIFAKQAVTAAKLGIPLPGEGVTWAVVLGMEFILTFLLLTSVFGAAVDERGKAVKIGGFAIGLTVAFDILAGGKISGASMNPARSFGPALVQWHWDWHLLYWLGPIAGGVVAALVYHHLLLTAEPQTPGTATRKNEPKRAGAQR